MPQDTTLGGLDDWLIEYDGARWEVTRFDRPGKTVVGHYQTKKDAKDEVRERGFPDDVVTVFTKSGRDWDTQYVRQMSRSGRGLFDDLG